LPEPELITEEEAAMRWVYDKIKPFLDTKSIRAFPSGIPQGEALPAAYYTPVTSQDVTQGDQSIGGTWVFIDVMVQAEGLNYLDSVAYGMNDVLHKSKGSINGQYEINCFRGSPRRYPHAMEGQQFRDSGGRYRVLVRPLDETNGEN